MKLVTGSGEKLLSGQFRTTRLLILVVKSASMHRFCLAWNMQNMLINDTLIQVAGDFLL